MEFYGVGDYLHGTLAVLVSEGGYGEVYSRHQCAGGVVARGVRVCVGEVEFGDEVFEARTVAGVPHVHIAGDLLGVESLHDCAEGVDVEGDILPVLDILEATAESVAEEDHWLLVSWHAGDVLV